MKMRKFPFENGREYLLVAFNETTGEKRHFVAEWLGNMFVASEDSNGENPLSDYSIEGILDL